MKTARLDDICTLIVRGISPRYTEIAGVRVLNQKCIRNHSLSFQQARMHDVGLRPAKQDKFIQNGDVLVNSTGKGTLGRTALAESIDQPTLVDSHITIIRPKPGIFEPRYFAYLISQCENNFIEMATGTSGQTELACSSLKGYRVTYIEDVEEQRRVVKRLDAAFEKIDRAIELTEKNIHNSKALLGLKMHEYFQVSDSVKYAKFAEVCKEIFAGGDVPVRQNSKVETDKYKIPIYTNGERKNGLYGYTDIVRVVEPSVTVSARGTIGFTAIRREPFYPAVRLIVLTPDPEKVDIDYLDFASKSLTFLNTGTSIPQLTVPMIKTYKIPLPALNVQKDIVRELIKIRDTTNSLINVYKTKKDHLLALKQSLLTQAFSQSEVE